MSKLAGIALAVCGTIVVGAVLLVFGYIGFTNTANQAENGIRAQYADNQNVYDNGWKEVKEKAQVPGVYEKHLKELYDDAMHGRYGENGSQAVLQFIKEQNPTLAPELYVQ